MPKYLDTLTGNTAEAFLWTAGPDQTEDPEWFADMLRAGEVELKDAGTPDVSLVSRGRQCSPGVYLMRHPKSGVIAVHRQAFEDYTLGDRLMCNSDWRDEEIADLRNEVTNLDYKLQEALALANREWRSMDSAPKNGTKILVYGTHETRATEDETKAYSIGVVSWQTDTTYGSGWVNSDGYYDIYWEPVAWLPLPDAPPIESC